MKKVFVLRNKEVNAEQIIAVNPLTHSLLEILLKNAF